MKTNPMIYEYPVTSTNQSALVIFSGGQDSTTCLIWAHERFNHVRALSFDYGQMHVNELLAAKIITDNLDIEHEILSVGSILKGTSPLINPTAELEQYADSESLPGGLEKTFVPMRNQLFLTLAANHAYVLGYRNLVTGICQADSGGYPDCREDFANALQLAINLGTFTGEPGTIGNLKIHTPLMHLSKAESIDFAIDVGAYVALMWTHTTYDGKYPPVSHDHANLLRESGFIEVGLPDPLVVRAWFENLMELPVTSNYDSIRNDFKTPLTLGGVEAMLELVADNHVRNRNNG